jgi:hypothetical protein
MTDEQITKLAQGFWQRKSLAETAQETVSYKFDAMGFARAILQAAAQRVEHLEIECAILRHGLRLANNRITDLQAARAEQEKEECSLCDGEKSMPPEVGAYKYTCPHCDGSGKEPQSAAPASVAPTHQDVDDKSACSSKSAENCDQAVSAAQPAVTLPDRVIDTLFQAAGVSTYHPDGDQLEKLHDFAHRVAAEVLARLPSAPASTAPAVPEGWKLVPIEPTMDMVVEGFEAVSDFHDTDEYEEMSGCEGSAQSARVCYRAMLAAAPHQLKD